AELGVELVFGAAPAATQHKTAESAPEHHEAPVARKPEHHEEHEAAMSAEEIERLIRGALDTGIWSEQQVEDLLGHAAPLTVSVGVSGRHVHLSQEDLEALFGAGYELTPIKELSQPGQFAAKETVTLVGPKGVIERVRVLGPVRPSTQVEVLRGDTFKLGVPACVRMSGKLEGTPGITLAGPHGTVALPQGVIVAARHIHMTCDEAAKRGLHDGQVVSIAFGGERGGRLDNVVVRANNTSALDCHIDTEEANAFGIKNGSVVEIIK
ncbi:MAG: phosphate propanoyltransferase, partial [Parolsenella sp.]|uniref:phosphate propanoyltransferase n=1 Tax=Parolsenella sp. TaxID=2083006 RepID=UPI002E7A9BD7